MPVCLLAELDIHNAEKYRAYIEAAEPIVRRYGGEYVLRSDNVAVTSGGPSPDRVILIRFPSRQAMQECFACEEYVAIKHLREQSTTSRTLVIEEE